jgi:hypothetical protein
MHETVICGTAVSQLEPGTSLQLGIGSEDIYIERAGERVLAWARTACDADALVALADDVSVRFGMAAFPVLIGDELFACLTAWTDEQELSRFARRYAGCTLHSLQHQTRRG